MDIREIRHFHPCGGLGGGAKGFNLARAGVGSLTARFRCIGGFDNDPAACRDFQHLTGVPLTRLDLFSRDQYIQYHGHLPPTEWREATVADVHRAAGNERPHIIFCSMPCKGFSGLLSERASLTPKYQALNALALRGILLCLEAWADDPVEFILFENVPRIASERGRHLLDQIEQLLSHYGYASAETTHDCGELGGLAQSRKRFLLVARHLEKVPPYLFEPVKRSLRPVGEILERCPLPGDLKAGPMHRIPALQWKTWVRLAFVQAGKDWRSLKRLAVEGGVLRDFAITRSYPGNYGVCAWTAPMGTVTGEALPSNGTFSVADPRFGRGTQGTDSQSINARAPDPTIRAKYRVTHFAESTGTVIAGSTTGEGAFAVADPRPTIHLAEQGRFLNASHNRRRHSDSVSTRETLPLASDRLVCVIRAEDSTWHRPFTTYELAVFQSLIEPEEQLELDGLSDSAWRERIGNAVPSKAATAIAEVIGLTLLLTWTGETFVLGATPIWVRPIAIAVSLSRKLPS